MMKQGKSLVPVLIFALCEVMMVLGGQLNDSVVPTDFTVFFNARQERMTSDGLFNERQTGRLIDKMFGKIFIIYQKNLPFPIPRLNSVQTRTRLLTTAPSLHRVLQITN